MVKKVVNRIKKDNEVGARRAILEDLFYDFHKSRVEVFWMNFFRGIFFGVGTVVGGTIIVAIVLWILSLFADVPGGFGDFIQYVVDTVNSGNDKN